MIDRFTIKGPLSVWDGYGNLIANLAQSLLELGVDLNLVPVYQHDTADLSEEVIAATNKRPSIDDCQIGIATPNIVQSLSGPFKVLYSMYEVPILPRPWVHWLNSATINLVPCNWCRQVWKSNGVFDPIEVVPLGVDSRKWPFLERPTSRSVYTFLMAGTLQRRKNPLLAVQAFLEEFPDETDVQLVIKSLKHMPVRLAISDSRVFTISERWSFEQMLNLFRNSDCFVYPSSGEGFGLPPLEAMSTGLPVIVSSCTGMLEFANDNYCFPIPMLGSETNITANGDEGEVPIPCIRSLRKLMRLAYEQRDYARDLGQSASAWVQREFTWNRTASSLLRIINDSGIIFSEE